MSFSPSPICLIQCSKSTRRQRRQRAVEPDDPRLNLVERAFTVGEKNRL